MKSSHELARPSKTKVSEFIHSSTARWSLTSSSTPRPPPPTPFDWGYIGASTIQPMGRITIPCNLIKSKN